MPDGTVGPLVRSDLDQDALDAFAGSDAFEPALDVARPMARPGRGAVSNPRPRFDRHDAVAASDGWEAITAELARADGDSLA